MDYASLRAEVPRLMRRPKPLAKAVRNRLVRTRMPGGVAGARLTAAPYADQAMGCLLNKRGFHEVMARCPVTNAALR